jgi:diketogulonate reductase-like aldo/keto reductase
MQGKVFDIPLLKEMAVKYGRSVSRIVLCQDIRMGVITILKSAHPGRIRENMEIFDFETCEEDMQSITAPDKRMRVGADPDNFKF